MSRHVARQGGTVRARQGHPPLAMTELRRFVHEMVPGIVLMIGIVAVMWITYWIRR